MHIEYTNKPESITKTLNVNAQIDFSMKKRLKQMYN